MAKICAFRTALRTIVSFIAVLSAGMAAEASEPGLESLDCYKVLNEVRRDASFHPYAPSLGSRLAEATRLCDLDMDDEAIRIVKELPLLASTKLEGMRKDAATEHHF